MARLQRESSCQGRLNNSNLSVLEKLNLIIQPNRKPRPGLRTGGTRSKMQYPARFLNPISVACVSLAIGSEFNPFFPSGELPVFLSSERNARGVRYVISWNPAMGDYSNYSWYRACCYDHALRALVKSHLYLTKYRFTLISQQSTWTNAERRIIW